MATTPNYGFIMPDPTDLVTDLPADFEIFGDEVDLRVKALNPETTEGDLAYRGATADAKDRLGIGTAGQVLLVNAGATAPEWGTPAAPVTADNFSLLNAGGTALTGADTVTISGISAQNTLFVIIQGASIAGGGAIFVRFNADTASNYRFAFPIITFSNPVAANNFQSGNDNTTQFNIARHGNNDANAVNGYFSLQGCNSSGQKMFASAAGDNQALASGGSMRWLGGAWDNSATVSSISFISQNGNFDAGTAFVYGAA